MAMRMDFTVGFMDQLKSWNQFSELQVANLTGLAVAQARHESGDFTSRLSLKYHNCIGYGYYSGSRWQSGRATDHPEDSGVYANYLNYKNCGAELADYIHRRAAMFKKIPIDGVAEYAALLKEQKYYTDSVANYTNSMKYYYDHLEGDYSEEEPSKVLEVATEFVRPPIIYYVLGGLLVMLIWFGSWSFRKIFFWQK